MGQKMNNFRITTALKGMIVGGTMLVPGISGGTMAMILGVYDQLVSSVSSFFKHKRHSFYFLLIFSLGGGIGMFLFAKPLLNLIELFPLPMIYFFLGAVAGGIPLIFNKANIKTFSWKVPIYIVLGFLIVLLISLLPMGIFQTEITTGLVDFSILMVAGFIAAIALVLPGISISYLFLVMGLYDEIMRAISKFYLPFLIPLGLGLILGIVMTTKVLENAMVKYPQLTYSIILGFIIGSMAEIFPGVPTGLELLICIAMIVAGFGTITLISWGECKIVR